MGIIRPPWITKEDFYRTPFNFCHRWCERCQLTSICKVYKEGEKDRRDAIKEGKDPDSWDFTLEVMKKNFEKVAKMIARDAKRLGINLKEINKIDEKEYEKYVEEKEKLHEDDIYQKAVIWSQHLKLFLDKFTEVPIESPLDIVIEAREILSWYMPLIPAKVFRAISSAEEEKDSPEEYYSYDDKTSAFIAYNGLVECAEVLLHLSLEKSLELIHFKCVLLSKECLDLAGIIKMKYYFGDEKVRN